MKVSKEFTFDSAHNLVEYKGKCEALHGHTYKLRVTIDAPVGDDGLAFDFVDLKRLVEEKVIDRLDHAYLNDVIPQPTAENLVIWIWNELKTLPLCQLRLWETATSFVTYNGPEA